VRKDFVLGCRILCKPGGVVEPSMNDFGLSWEVRAVLVCMATDCYYVIESLFIKLINRFAEMIGCMSYLCREKVS